MAPPKKLRLIAKMPENIRISRQILHDVYCGFGAIIEQAQTMMDMVTAMKRRA